MAGLVYSSLIDSITHFEAIDLVLELFSRDFTLISSSWITFIWAPPFIRDNLALNGKKLLFLGFLCFCFNWLISKALKVSSYPSSVFSGCSACENSLEYDSIGLMFPLSSLQIELHFLEDLMPELLPISSACPMFLNQLESSPIIKVYNFS